MYLLSVICLTFFICLGGICYAQDSLSLHKKPKSKDTTDEGYKPMLGSRVASTKYGDINIRLYAYLRYLNQLGLQSASFTNSFGQTSPVKLRQDVQIQKVTVYFAGWFLEPKFRYLLYIWTNNASQGLGAQVVVAGNLSYNFNKYISLSGGIMSLPGTRSTEGNFPFWLSVDNRMMSDEFFRPSFTTGLQVKGEIVKKLNYKFMIGNNLSQLGVDAGQLDNGFNTVSAALIYLPTTGEYGMYDGSFGDFDGHKDIATRLGLHYTRSNEDRQGQPSTDAFENVQIRLSDGSVIFTPNLFGEGTQIDNARYQMTCFDAGIKYKGLALEGEVNWRRVDHFTVIGPSLNFDRLNDYGYQVIGSGMVLPKKFQLYTAYSRIYGEYGDPWEFRAGVNFYPFKSNYSRLNAQYIYLHKSPVGNTSLPYTVGGTGSIYNVDFEINF